MLRLVRTAHRFGLRVYFDNIVNHRGFDVPGYDANTPTNLYPGMVPGDFHLRTIPGGFHRNVSGIRDDNNVWQVQNLSLCGLVDIAHENPNANFGPTEGSTAPKPVLVRQARNPELYDFNSSGVRIVVLFAMNDNYGNTGDISFDDGVAQDDSGMPSTCYQVVNSRGQGLVVGFPPGSRLRQMADSPGKDRACPELLVRLATANLGEAQASANDPNPVNRKIFVGSQAPAPGGGAIELRIPSGGYVCYAFQWPEASRVDTTLPSSAGLVSSTDTIVLQQGGRSVPRLTVYRTDGKDGDPVFNPVYPFKMRGSIDLNGNVVGGSNFSNRTYTLTVPVVTNGPLNILVRTDGSAVNSLLKLDGGVDLNSHMNLGARATTAPTATRTTMALPTCRNTLPARTRAIPTRC